MTGAPFCYASRPSRLSMNRPTPDPSQAGSRRVRVLQYPSWEGLGVGSWSQCTVGRPRRLFMNTGTSLRLGGRFLTLNLNGATESKSKRFMAPMHGRNAAKALHEPTVWSPGFSRYGRLKAGLRTDGTPQTGSWSQRTAGIPSPLARRKRQSTAALQDAGALVTGDPKIPPGFGVRPRRGALDFP